MTTDTRLTGVNEALRISEDYYVSVIAAHVRYIDEMLVNIDRSIEEGYPTLAQRSIQTMRQYIAKWPEEAKEAKP
jgi:hypothetical protein